MGATARPAVSSLWSGLPGPSACAMPASVRDTGQPWKNRSGAPPGAPYSA
jgi:hypothetical protein